MKLMFNDNDGGFHNFSDDEVEQATKDGWVDGEPIRKRIIDAKRSGVAKVEEPATINAQPEVRRAGRPRKDLSSILGVNDGHSTNAD